MKTLGDKRALGDKKTALTKDMIYLYVTYREILRFDPIAASDYIAKMEEAKLTERAAEVLNANLVRYALILEKQGAICPAERRLMIAEKAYEVHLNAPVNGGYFGDVVNAELDKYLQERERAKDVRAELEKVAC